MRALQLYVRALAAAAFLALTVFGTPILLYALIGNPLPAWDAVKVGDFSDDTILHLMATLAWIGWASLVLAVTVEARAQVAERPAPTLPLLPGSQDFARSLIAAFLVAAPTIAATTTAAHPAGPPTNSDPVHPGRTSGQALHPGASDRREHPSRPGQRGQGETAARNDPRIHTPALTPESRPPMAPVSARTALPDPLAADRQGTDRPAAPVAPAPPAAPTGMFLLGAGSSLGASLGAAGIYAVVQRHRRHQAAARQPGYLPALTPPDLVPIERRLTTSAWIARALHERLYTALQTLDATRNAEDLEPVAILAARLDTQQIELVLAHPAGQRPPAPWRADPATGRWILDSRADIPDIQSDQQSSAPAAPRPAPESEPIRRWAWVGSSPTASASPYAPGGPQDEGTDQAAEPDVWLLNVIAAGSIAVVGRGPEAPDLLRALLLSLADPAFLPWTTRPARRDHVSIHSTAPDLTNLADLLGASTGRSKTAPPEGSFGVDVLDERGGNASSAPQRTTPGAEPPDTASCTVVLSDDVTGARPETVRLVLGARSRLSVSFAATPLTAAAVTQTDLDRLHPLLAAAQQPAIRPAPWLTPSPAGQETRPVNDDQHTPPHSNTLLHRGRHDSRTEAVQPPHPAPAPTASRSADPALDDDLRLWHSGRTTRPRVRLLGPVEVLAAGQPPARGRIPWWTEVVVLLAAHPAGLDPDQFAENLWPRDAGRKASTAMPRQTISTVRAWLGNDPVTGQPYLPRINTYPSGGRYHIEHLLTDADLARRLYTRATDAGPEGINDLQAALDLVTGPVLDQHRPKGYLWLLDVTIIDELTALITDIAHALALRSLAEKRPDQAERASRVALDAGCLNDVTYLDLITSAEILGRRLDSERWRNQLLQLHSVDVEEDLPVWTANRLRRLRYQIAALVS